MARDTTGLDNTVLPADASRADNLWYPVSRDFAAHGRFDDRARSASAELWIAKRKPWLALGTAMLGAVIAGAAVTARHDDE